MDRQVFRGGWRELEDHLVKAHGLSETLVFDLDSDHLRKLHDEAHRWGQFAAMNDHQH